MSYENKDISGQRDSLHPSSDSELRCFPERLKNLMGNTGARAFARSCGLSEGAIRSYLSGETYPTLDRLEQIAWAHGVSPIELAFGKVVSQPTPEEDEKFAYIPLYDARISSGHGAWNDGVKVLTMLAFTRYSLRKKGLDPTALCCVQNDGDSNEPELSDGDTVMVDRSKAAFLGDALYVIRMGDCLYAKRLQRQFDGGLQIISTNAAAYKPVAVPPDRVNELEIVGRAVWAGGWLI